jgi:hypothetical protein
MNEPTWLSMTEHQRSALEAFIGQIIFERRNEALRKGEDTIPIGDIGDSRLLMERAFLAGWFWGAELKETATPA